MIRLVRTSTEKRRSILAALTMAAAVVFAASATAAKGTATTTIDRTLACELGSPLPGFTVFTRVNEAPMRGLANPGAIDANSGNQLPQVLYAGASKLLYVVGPDGKPRRVKSGYWFDSTACRSTGRIPLSSSGLHRLGVFSRAGNAELTLNCPLVNPTSLIVRLRVRLARPGMPSAAQLAVAFGRARRSVAFVNWTPTRFTAFASSSLCY